MLHQEFKVPEELRDTIQGFWYTSIDFGEEPSSFEIMPDGHAEIVFHFGNDCSILQHGVLQPLPSPFIMGLLNQPVVISAKNQLQVIGIRCFPWSVFDLLGLSPGKGVRIFEHPIAQLQPTLNKWIEADKIKEAIAEVKRYLLNMQSGIATDTMLSKAGDAMNSANGNLPVSKVAAAAHATIRTLERKFKQSSGHTVKDVSGLMRFEQVRNQLMNDPKTNLASLAYQLGYTDQSHLSREFKRYSGDTPAAFARKVKQGKSAVGNDFIVLVRTHNS